MADSVPVLMWSNDRWCASVNFDTVIRACRGIQYGVEGSSLKSGPAEGVIKTFCEPHFAVTVNKSSKLDTVYIIRFKWMDGVEFNAPLDTV